MPDDLSGDVFLRGHLEGFEAGARVELHHLGAGSALEHVDAADGQADGPGGEHGGLLVVAIEADGFSLAAAVDVAAELAALRLSAHRADDLVTDHERAHVAAA